MGGQGSGATPRWSDAQLARALRYSRGNASQAARFLGCNRGTVWRYLKRLKRRELREGVSDEPERADAV